MIRDKETSPYAVKLRCLQRLFAAKKKKKKKVEEALVEEYLTVRTINMWLAPLAGKINQILRLNWLPERTRWSYLARSGLYALFRKKNFPESHIINPLLTTLVRSTWLDIGLVLFWPVYGPRLPLSPSSFFCLFVDLHSVSVHKQAKKSRQCPAILTSNLVNDPYINKTDQIRVSHMLVITWLCSRAMRFQSRPTN